MAGTKNKKKNEDGATKASRLTVKDVFGEIDDDELSTDVTTPVARFYGVVNKFKVGEGKNGDWVCYIGQMIGVNHKTGEQFETTRLFLPAEASDSLYERCAPLAVGGEAKGVGKTTRLTEEVEFAYDLGVYYDKTSPTNYLYEVIDHKEGDVTASKSAAARIGEGLPEVSF